MGPLFNCAVPEDECPGIQWPFPPPRDKNPQTSLLHEDPEEPCVFNTQGGGTEKLNVGNGL